MDIFIQCTQLWQQSHGNHARVLGSERSKQNIHPLTTPSNAFHKPNDSILAKVRLLAPAYTGLKNSQTSLSINLNLVRVTEHRNFKINISVRLTEHQTFWIKILVRLTEHQIFTKKILVQFTINRIFENIGLGVRRNIFYYNAVNGVVLLIREKWSTCIRLSYSSWMNPSCLIIRTKYTWTFAISKVYLLS